jgi:hypothetical protein
VVVAVALSAWLLVLNGACSGKQSARGADAGSDVNNRSMVDVNEGSIADSEGDAGDGPRADAEGNFSGCPTPDAGGAVSEVMTADAGSQCRAWDGATPTFCNDGWCWISPLPQGEPLHGISGTARDDVWSVGEAGTILHWDGGQWSLANQTNGPALYGVFARTRDDAWAVGDGGVILRWNGAGWAGVPSGTTTTLRSVWASACNNAWALGDTAILHWDGVRWSGGVGPTSASAVAPRAIWGSAADDVWVFDATGVWHYDGSVWSLVKPPNLEPLETIRIWGTARDDVWFVGGYFGNYSYSPSHIVEHWDGTSWTDRSPPGSDYAVFDIGGTGRDDVWVSTPNDVWRWDGAAWSSLFHPMVPSDVSFYSNSTVASSMPMWGASACDLWFVGTRGDVGHWDGADLVTWPRFNGYLGPVSVWASGPDDAWTIGGDGDPQLAGHWDGTKWTWQAVAACPYQGGVPRSSLWGTGTTNVWTACGPIAHWDGASWAAAYHPPASMTAVFGSAPNDVWFVGDGGNILHYDGASWQNTSSGTMQRLNAVWARASGDAWAAGNGGTILHWDGTRWSPSTSGVSDSLLGAWGFSATDIWVVGSAGTALHWDGSAWRRTASGTTQDLLRVAGLDAQHVWAAAPGGTFRWNGAQWAVGGPPVSTPYPSGQLGLWADVGSRTAWLAGGWESVLVGTF